ncbi:MAG: HNH endonuclease [Candidatus Moraniibacteriota bacterium]
MRKINRPACPNSLALTKNYKHPENKTVLVNASFGKCMYCEEMILSSQFGDVEHIKPKSKFQDLAFNWDNLGWACSKCNSAKADKYYENNAFIDPYNEDPEDYIIAIGAFLAQKKGSERGELTISEISLNRNELVEKRYEKIKKIEKAINSCFRTKDEKLKNNALEELKGEANEDKEYSLCIKHMLKSHEII